MRLGPARGGRRGRADAARQIAMHDVEAARAQREPPRLDVDDDLVADLAGADEPDVRPRRRALALDVDLEARAVGGDHGCPAQLQQLVPPSARARATRTTDGRDHYGCSAAASRSAKVTSSMDSSAATLTRSVGSWLRSVPLATLVQGNPAASSALASDAPPVTIRRGA